MASCAPAECRACAIAQAMLRLLATPKTTAVRPLRSMDIWPRLRTERITEGTVAGRRWRSKRGVPRRAFACLRADQASLGMTDRGSVMKMTNGDGLSHDRCW